MLSLADKADRLCCDVHTHTYTHTHMPHKGGGLVDGQQFPIVRVCVSVCVTFVCGCVCVCMCVCVSVCVFLMFLRGCVCS